ncbi:MAG: hypothetical protein MI723_13760 [Caulobacterales bacterium]|nr:hypothetical protein [Caulobacterales bacterium]
MASSACATVSIGGSSEPPTSLEASLAPAQAELRGAAQALEEAGREAGWSQVDVGDRVQSAIAMLLHGRKSESAARRTDPVDVYLDGKTRSRAEDTFAAVGLDVDIAAFYARQINDAAAAVIAETGVDHATLNEDVRALERSIGAARRARALFRNAIARQSDRSGAEKPADLAVRMAALDGEIGRMSDMADALNMLRLSALETREGPAVG